MKSYTKIGLAFGIGLMVFLIIYGFLQLEDFTVTNVVRLIARGIISGLIGGLLFGWINKKFSAIPK